MPENLRRPGRPTKYVPAMCDRVIALGAQGMGKAEMAVELGVAYSTFDLWQKDRPEFSEAVKEAVRQSQAWWERQGRLATFGKLDGFNATAFIFQMKNRFREDWRDRHDLAHMGADGGAVKTETRVLIVPPKAEAGDG